MADLTKNVLPNMAPRGSKNSWIIKDGVTLGVGALVEIDATGYLTHWSSGLGTAVTFVGILIGGDSRLDDGVIIGETSDSPSPRGLVDTSGPTLTGRTVAGTPTLAKVGDLVWCADSDPANLTLTDPGAEAPVGWLSDFRTATDHDVTLFTPEEWLAGVADNTWIAA